jgi:tripartite ATP-independent transporter DctM subunit
MLIGFPVAFSVLFTSLVYLWVHAIPLEQAVANLANGISSFILIAIPLYIFAGKIMNTGGMTKRIFNFASKLVGFVPGGLGHVNVIASIIFAGMTGSATADAGGLGAIEIKAMTDEGYDIDFSIGVTVGSSAIGPIIPPSIAMVIYGAIAEESIAKLFVGGIVPGLLMGIALMIMVYIYAVVKKYPKYGRASLKQIAVAFKDAFLPSMTPVIILSGMLFGIFTPTEAAGVAVLYAIILGGFVYRELKWKDLINDLLDTAKITISIMFIIGAASIFSWIMAREQIGMLVLKYFYQVSFSPLTLMFLFAGLFLLLGCFMESTAIMIIFLPIVLPILRAYNVSLVYFGVFFVLDLIIGLCTPPFGQVIFVVAQMTKLPFSRVVKAVIPFLIPLICVLILIILIPKLILVLPDMLVR